MQIFYQLKPNVDIGVMSTVNKCLLGVLYVILISLCCYNLQVLAALNFYASGSYQRRAGGDLTAAMCQSALSGVIRQVTRAIVTILLPQWVKFPVTPAARNAVKQRYAFR